MPLVGKSRVIGTHRFRWQCGQWMVAAWLCLGTLQVGAFQTVTLAWDPNADPVVGYKLYYGPTNSSGAFRHVLDLGNVTAVSVSNLLEGVTYYFAVSAYNAVALESGFSDRIVYTVPGGEIPTNAVV